MGLLEVWTEMLRDCSGAAKTGEWEDDLLRSRMSSNGACESFEVGRRASRNLAVTGNAAAMSLESLGCPAGGYP